MKNVDVIRAWRDPEYRATLSAEQLNALPANPAGVVELSALELENVNGGTFHWTCTNNTICQVTSGTAQTCCSGNHSETLILA
ncbi:mersacidin/lichenicidin family type 2 lantibiotic [Nannocystis radixulma]|uniref:Mersacidin/lichenicidin family type 2 lantibiotic n=1 Tax=Nannocystis radixulma TaxID=2995305 RepID=A0ABT5BDD4_9BACT|nr:mersacidin/lichenicidin family type 2 lantibiotic [Nannocystis radixulma]MDC0672148.1 mersacidin/lichenicidin family type 2 lantibiotic [Nannocystis radixulma]